MQGAGVRLTGGDPETAVDPDRTCRSVRAREAEAKELLCELIRIPSLPGCEQPAVTLLRDWLADRSVPVRLVEIDDAIKDDPDYSFGDEPFEYAGRHNLVAELGGASGRGLIVSTHLDVVPAGGWDGAFAPREECGEIIGRGACDAKGQVVAAAVALAALADAGAGLDGRVSAHFVVEEEVGGNGALALLAGAEGAEGGEGADGALVMEPTGFNVHPANRGALWFRLAVTGRASHMGRRHEGVNAIEKMVPLIAGLRRYEEQLLEESTPAMIRQMKQDGVNVVVLIPG